MKVYDQLKKIELAYNTYKLSKDEAVKQAQPLLDKFNKGSTALAHKHNQYPKLIKITHFAFGR